MDAKQVEAWLDHETGFRDMALEPLETTEQKNARLVSTANKQPLNPNEVYDYIQGTKQK